MTSADDTGTWERGWEGHRAEQLRRLARLPLAEKLRWLEEAARTVRHLSEPVERMRPNESRRSV
jgi:hypothetical protein